MEVKILQYY